MTSYEIKADCQGILDRVSVTRWLTSLAYSDLQWGSSPDWAAVRQILRCADVSSPGRKPKPSILLGIRTPNYVKR